MTDFDPGPRWRPEPDPGRVEHELDPRDVADAYDLLDGEAFYELDDDDD